MDLELLYNIKKSLKLREFAVTHSFCPICAAKRPIVRLNHNEIAVRCLACRATPVTMAIAAVLQQLVPELSTKVVYELSSRGPLVTFLKKKCKKLTCSEYFDNVQRGEYHNNILCQDVQQLTFEDNSFDICTSTEVFEHVPDDRAGFSEIKRVLRPQGLFLFTVPLFPSSTTVERARLLDDGGTEHILAPQYHGDPIRGRQPILVFRDYGSDILQQLLSQGFARAEFQHSTIPLPWGLSRPVIAAYKQSA